MYQSFPGQAPGWYVTCGTSEATPLFAGVIALVDQVAGHPVGLINPALVLDGCLRGEWDRRRDIGEQHGDLHPGRQDRDRQWVRRSARL